MKRLNHVILILILLLRGFINYSQTTVDFQSYYYDGILVYDWGPEIPVEETFESFVHEAEDLEFDHATVQNLHQGYTGRGYVDGNYWDTEAYVQYSHEFNYPNNFYFGVVSAGERPCKLILNGEVYDTLYFEGSNDWNRWTFTTLPIEFEPGLNTVKIEPITSAGLPNIDKIIVAWKDQVVLPVSVNEPNLCLKNYQIDNAPFGYAGTKIFYSSGATDELKLALNNTSDKDVYIETTYRLNGNDNSFQIKINGENIYPQMIRSDTTLTWQSAHIILPLQKGVNSFEIVSKNVDIYYVNFGGRDMSFAELSCNQDEIIRFGEDWCSDCVPYNLYDGIIEDYYINIDYGVGKRLEMALIMPHSGFVDFNVDYAIYNDRPAKLLVNGEETGTTLPFSGTGSITNWSTQSFTYYLSKGVNYITLEALSRGGLANIYYTQVEAPSGTWAMKLNSKFESAGNDICYRAFAWSPIIFQMNYSNSSLESEEIILSNSDLFNTDWTEHNFRFNSQPNSKQNIFAVDRFGGAGDYSYRGLTLDDSIEIDKIIVYGENLQRLNCNDFYEYESITNSGNAICFDKSTNKMMQFTVEFSNTTNDTAEGRVFLSENAMFEVDYTFSCLPNTESGFATGYIWGEGMDNFTLQAEITQGTAQIISISLTGIDLNEVECEVGELKFQKENEQMPACNNIHALVKEVQKEFTVSVHSKVNGNAAISIVDVSGKQLKDQKCQIVKGANLISVDINELQAGMYIAYIVADGIRFSEKFVVVH